MNHPVKILEHKIVRDKDQDILILSIPRSLSKKLVEEDNLEVSITLQEPTIDEKEKPY